MRISDWSSDVCSSDLDALLMLRRDADAGIMHDNVDPGFTGLFTGRGGDGDGAVAGELGCIGKQVDDSLAQLGDVGIDLHGAGCMLDDAAIALLVELATADGQGIVDDVRQAAPLQETVPLACLARKRTRINSSHQWATRTPSSP